MMQREIIEELPRGPWSAVNAIIREGKKIDLGMPPVAFTECIAQIEDLGDTLDDYVTSVGKAMRFTLRFAIQKTFELEEMPNEEEVFRLLNEVRIQLWKPSRWFIQDQKKIQRLTAIVGSTEPRKLFREHQARQTA
jgi:hypothetical protein